MFSHEFHFYFNHYKIYEKFALRLLPQYFAQVTMPRIRSVQYRWEKNIQFNILKFVQELRTEEFVPSRYYQ